MNQKLLEPSLLHLLQNKFLSLGQRYSSQPIVVDRGIVMPDILHADRQLSLGQRFLLCDQPNESETARSKAAASSAEQVPVPRSTIRQSAIHGGPWNCDA